MLNQEKWWKSFAALLLAFSHLFPRAAADLAHIPSVGSWSLVPEEEETLLTNY